ncbi:hypothetical protein HBI81_107640 [Parastagonospora nodorum]|nr:hypothetical protein HBH51_065920 [Parastagonospora nodorum]KAH4188246.1 hypothetical protein HBI95_230600 [Parastagonospora nodorum]KAH4225052.1 hypothetical protein HBI06_122820 [Parastagonospora nodorum]KAH4229777.1 hypothetical protein HBI05_195750 [Parastagonospora nodorum]KAH4946865.1 hypothetical protein HBH74_043430 [Parastagonospora nodorum]
MSLAVCKTRSNETVRTSITILFPASFSAFHVSSSISMRQFLHFFDALSIIRTKPLRSQLHPQIRPEDKSHTRNAA